MSFPEAVGTCLRKYADFSGRATRPEFWYFALWLLLVSVVAGILDSIVGRWDSGSGPIETLVTLAFLLPYLAVGARRLHDISRSGWTQLLVLLPCIGFVLLVFWWVQASDGDNKYGPAPGSRAHSI
jgi:uncharacterized membrane protein YhaH (DUF805 family)